VRYGFHYVTEFLKPKCKSQSGCRIFCVLDILACVFGVVTVFLVRAKCFFVKASIRCENWA